MADLGQDNSSEPEQDCNNAEERQTNVRRPMNAFFIFCKRHRDIVREKYPHLENRSITKILGEWWANLEPLEKVSYTALAKQYKEAFMKAHPDFKWYKLPAPPTRTLVTRPSNYRFNQNENFNTPGNCGITLGKLVDDEHLGGLSTLINSTPTVSPSTSTKPSTPNLLKMDEKGENVLKPPKKRYLQNGEFQSQINESSIESRDFQSQINESSIESREFQSQIKESSIESRKFQSQIKESSIESREFQSQIKESSIESREFQSQIKESSFESREFQSQIKESSIESQEFQSQIKELSIESREFQSQIKESSIESREFQSQIKESSFESREFQSQIKELSIESLEFQSQIKESSFESREFQSQIKESSIKSREFQSQINESSIESRDFQTRDACSALLELAEVCSSSIAQEISSAQSCSNNSISTSTAILDHGYSFPYPATSDVSLPADTIVSSIDSNSQQDQPLDLCKNKDKSEVLTESSKTITTSHQQLIDHFVDKFLCDTPVPPKFYKSEIIDPALCKMFAEKNQHISPSKEGKISHSAFTLSVAIESAVDKAYSKDNSNSCKSKISDLNDLKSLPNNNSKFNKHLKVEETASSPKKSFNFKTNSKFGGNRFWPAATIQNCEKKAHLDKPMNKHVGNLLNSSQALQEMSVTPGSLKNKSYDNLIAVTKKPRVWGNFFKNEQPNNNSQHSSQVSSQISNSFISELSERRSSQRSCKGKRYQALLTEGLLQSHKERKLGYNKKTLPYQYKMKSKIDSFFKTPTLTSPKKRRKEYGCKSKSSTEAYGIGTSLFNLEEKIASLPKCSFENLNKKRKNAEINIESFEQEARDVTCTTSFENASSKVTESPSIPSSGRYRTGNFDLEQQISFLPKCNVEVLSKRNKE